MKYPILRRTGYVAVLMTLLFSTFASAQLLVVKQRFETNNFKTFNGESIKQVASTSRLLGRNNWS